MFKKKSSEITSLTSSSTSCSIHDSMAQTHSISTDYDRVQYSDSVTILHKGYLTTKRGLLKADTCDYYFLMENNPRLFSFKDETCFERWTALSRPWLNPKVGDGITEPKYVCTVIRADRTVGGIHSKGHGITILEGPAAKFISRNVITTSRPSCDVWLEAFRKVQLQKLENAKQSSTTSFSQSRLLKRGESAQSCLSPAHNSRGSLQSTPKFAIEFENDVGKRYRSSMISSERSDLDSASSRSMTESSGYKSDFTKTRQPSQQNDKVLLFVPGAISTLSTSSTKLSSARAELENLLKNGKQRPSRRGLSADDVQHLQWRYGVPDFILYDITYIRGKTRNDQNTPLESYIESCCHSFIMDSTYKCKYQDWVSVQQQEFYITVNDGEKIDGSLIQENDMFGLLYLNEFQDWAEGTNEEGQNAQILLASAFSEGFPMEVLDVYSQPPRCHFAWRHWGPFSGRYKGVKGDNRLLEIRGFAYVEIDSCRMLSLDIYYKAQSLFKALDDAREDLSLEGVNEH
nr:conserved hypothetical protein [Albugo laibachii Nc14]|eukprot:CCA22111.1 conserved hypothetical protein [Albugo laibachii Nc14]